MLGSGLPYTLDTSAADPLAVSLAEAKRNLRVDHDFEDLDILQKLQSAQAYVEDFTGPLIESTWSVYSNHFGGTFRLPGTLAATPNVSIAYTVPDGTVFTVPPTVYEVDAARFPQQIARKYQQLWPTATLKASNGVRIQATYGWANSDAVPQRIRSAILVLLTNLWMRREEFSQEAIHALVAPYRILQPGWYVR